MAQPLDPSHQPSFAASIAATSQPVLLWQLSYPQKTTKIRRYQQISYMMITGNIKSTKAIQGIESLATFLDLDLTQEPSNHCSQEAFTLLFNQKELACSYSDQTGRLPVQSGRGNNYVFILYNYNSKSILSNVPSKWQGNTICDAWIKKLKQLQHNV